MSKQIYLRMLGYAVTIPLHITNMVVMMSSFKGEVMKDAYVKHFSEMQVFFFTCWTFTFQTVFAAFSLYYDIQSLKNAHTDYKPPKIVDFIRREAFISIIWPSSILVFLFFWSFFFYDRNLLYPVSIDKAISKTSNHIMHTAILPIVLWELMFYHRSRPKNALWRLLVTFSIELIYLLTLLYVHNVYGVWVYPIFGKLYGSQWFPLFFVGTGAFLTLIYNLQWHLYSTVWNSAEKTTKKVL